MIHQSRHLPPAIALYLQAAIIVFFLAASSAPTPLYAVYQSDWGFSPITTTVVFGVYALAVLAALLTVGKLSDHVGRRPVLLAAIAAQAAAMIVFTTAAGVSELMLARVVQGLATGAAAGAVGAGMLDLNRAKGTILNAIAPMTGTATGAIASGLLVQFLPAPRHLIYLVLLGIFVLLGIGVVLMAETSSPKAGALNSLKPDFALPPAVRAPLALASSVLVAVWALAGFYGSVGPSLTGLVVGSDSLSLGGLALFTLAASGAVTVLLLRSRPPRTVMVFGTVALIVGVGITLIAIAQTSALVFFVGTAVAGAGFGGGFQGAIRTVLPLAAPHERAGVLSTMYVVSYLGMGLPAVIAGVLVVHGGGLLATSREYAIAVMALAALALVGMVRRQHPAIEPLAVEQPPRELVRSR
jgi:MFS family permease